MRTAALALLLVLLAPLTSLAQDLEERRGFSVEIVEPRTGDIVSGRSMIRAKVNFRYPEQIERVSFYVNDRLLLADREPPWQVEYDFGVASQQHVIRVVARHRDGPEVSDFAITRTLDLKYVVNVRRVVLDVSVRDSRRRVVTGLDVPDFAISEEGRPQRVMEVSTEERPILVGVLMDSSGSMREREEPARRAACGFLETLRPEDRAFVIDFDERVFLIDEVSNDFSAACRSLDGTVAVGGTAVYDAIHAAFRVIYQQPAERRAFVILSDGDDTQSRLELKEIVEEAQFSDVTIYTIGLGVPVLSEARKALRTLSDMTGGRSFFVKRAEDLAGVYELIAEELRTLYQVVYASDNETFDGRFVDIDLQVKGRRDLDVKYRKGYYAVDSDAARR